MRMPSAMVARYAASRVGPDLALRVYTSRLLGGEPRLVLARRRQHVGQDRGAGPARRRRSRCCASRAAAGTWATSSRRACPPCVSRRCASCARAMRCRDEEMVRRAARQPARSRRAEPVGRDAAARLSAAQIHRPHARDRGAEPRRSARCGRASAPTSTAADRHRALHHAGLSARQEGRRSLRGRTRGRGAGAA